MQAIDVVRSFLCIRREPIFLPKNGTIIPYFWRDLVCPFHWCARFNERKDE